MVTIVATFRDIGQALRTVSAEAKCHVRVWDIEVAARTMCV